MPNIDKAKALWATCWRWRPLSVVVLWPCFSDQSRRTSFHSDLLLAYAWAALYRAALPRIGLRIVHLCRCPPRGILCSSALRRVIVTVCVSGVAPAPHSIAAPQVSREKGPPPEEAHFPSPPHGVQGSASPPISGPMPPSRMPQLFPRPKLPPRQGSWPSGGPRPPAQPPKQMALAIPSLRPQEVAKAKPRAPRMRGSVAVLLEDVETAL